VSREGDRCEKCVRHEPPVEDVSEERREEHRERFGELFNAARALWAPFKAGVADEDVVYATLVFANEVGQRSDFAAEKERLVEAWNDANNANAWREEAVAFTRKHKGFAPVSVVDEVLLLGLQPAIAVVRNYRTTDVPEEVEIRVLPRRHPASPEQVADAYEDALSDAGIPYDVSHRISLYAEFREGLLWISVKNGEEVPEQDAFILRGRNLRFPHPRLVGAIYRALYGKLGQDEDGFARWLEPRQERRRTEIYNLIPPCVALLLRMTYGDPTYGDLKWREVCDLLDENMPRARHPQGGVLEEQHDQLSYHSRERQLKADVRKIKQKLVRIVGALNDPGE
jgi:hypothetical protein